MRAAVFDVDGTLLDSMSVWEDIGERYLADHKIAVRGNLRNALRTMSLEQGAAWLKEEYQLKKSIPQIIEEVLKIVSNFYRFEAPLKSGVKETLEWLKERNVKMVIATSGNRKLAEAALEGAAGKEHRAAAPCAADAGLLPVVQGSAGGFQGSACPAEAGAPGGTVCTAAAGAEGAAGGNGNGFRHNIQSPLLKIFVFSIPLLVPFVLY